MSNLDLDYKPSTDKTKAQKNIKSHIEPAEPRQHQNDTIVNKQSESKILAFEALNSCPSYIDSIAKEVKSAAKNFYTGNTQQANKSFAEMINILDLFIQLITQIHQTIKISPNTKLSTGKTLHQLQIHLLSVLKAITISKEKNDILMLCDLLEHELLDNLTQWKIDAIPKLKRLKNI